MVMGTFFHLFAHDVDGPLGGFLRSTVYSIFGREILGDLDDRTFAFVVTSIFIQITGILMLPEFLGPSFSIFYNPFSWIFGQVSHRMGSQYTKVNPFPSQNTTANKQPPVELEMSANSASNVATGKRKKKKKNKVA
jgi:hypothetical protein